MDKKIEYYSIDYNKTIRDVLKKECFSSELFITLVDESRRVVGVLTDGDFRRAVWNNVNLEDSVRCIMNKNFKSVSIGYNDDEIKSIFANTNINHIPVIENSQLVDVVTSQDFSSGSETRKKEKVNTPVVIMAGGLGTRLDPFTRVLPKPLIPIGDKPIIRHIIDKFCEFGISDFKLSVNHKSKIIKAYFEEDEGPFKVSFLYENKPLGTGGALATLEDKVETPIFVTNCDILINTNYADILKHHVEGDYDFTIVGAIHHHIVPYGVIELGSEGELGEMNEKPTFDFLVNTGMYVLSPQAIKMIPKDQHFNLTDLAKIIKERGGKTGVFPISQGSWLDIGQWEEYKQTVKKIESFI